MSDINNAISILEKLVSCESISGRPTTEIVDYIQDYLNGLGVEVQLSFDEAGERANVFATIGPQIDGGVVLNGHTDVVPVAGQVWSSEPFVLRAEGDRLYGRGAVDMKGFLACALAAVPTFQASSLAKPIHIAFSFDEETGGFGMPYLLQSMAGNTFRPDIVIVGEPTEMDIITGHKGGDEMRTEIIGYEVHSSDPRRGTSAIAAASMLIAKIEEMGAAFAASPSEGSAYEPPYATFNVGTIEGGAARNATAGWCNFDWEFRPMPGDDNEAVISEIRDYARDVILPPMKAVSGTADIRVITEVSVPGLDDKNAARAAEFVAEVTGRNSRGVVSFGTDAGYFSDAGFSTVVCGPGSIKRAHIPDEYITRSELAQGLDFMSKIARKLCG